MCLSDLMLVDYPRSINWMQAILEPYLVKLNDLAQLKQLDKITLNQTCHILNLLSQFMSSLIQRQQTHNNNENEHDTSSSSFINNSLNVSHNANTNNANNQNANNELTIAFSILVKLIPIYKIILNRNLPSDNVIIDKIFESISVVLSSSISSVDQAAFFNQNETVEYILNELVQVFFSLNENSWRRFAYEVCRQVRLAKMAYRNLNMSKFSFKLISKLRFLYSAGKMKNTSRRVRICSRLVIKTP
jgi:hypothetical protein